MGLPVIKTSGSGFLKSGDRWQIKGVTYAGAAFERSQSDPLTEGDQCAIDAPLIKELGANTITAYYIDPSKNHDACMQSFEDNGIYVIAAMPNLIDQSNEGWNMTQYTRSAGVVDAMAEYSNLLGLLIGLESISYGSSTNDNETSIAPSLKAAARDMKAYTAARGYRTIPIGYFGNDLAMIREAVASYLACGNSSEAIDFYGHNLYSWCGDSSFIESGYSKLNSEFGDLGVPVFISETGCNINSRKFSDQPVIFGSKMSAYWSGAVVYEWHESGNDYGLVNYTSTGTNSAAAQTPSILSDYSSLSTEWASCTINTTTPMTFSRTACPSSSTSYWTLDPSASLPTIAGLDIATVKRASATATSTTTSNLNNISGPTAYSSSSSSGLSAGAIAGIAVGVTVVLILISVAGFWFLYRPRRKSKAEKGKQADRGGHPEVAELSSSGGILEVPATEPIRELPTPNDNYGELYAGPGTHTHELPVPGPSRHTHELDDTSTSQEENGGQRRPSNVEPSSSSVSDRGEPRDLRAGLSGPFRPEVEGPQVDEHLRKPDHGDESGRT